MTILIPTLILVGIAIVCAALLTVASVFFGVKEDETAVAIRDCLPGANCGACGYSGCDGYAKALAEKSTDKTSVFPVVITSLRKSQLFSALKLRTL